MNFLPQNYEAPKTSNNYMKLQEGENRIRILSRPIVGWEDWDNKKPIRFTMDKKPPRAVDPLKPIKHFWALIVWNYQDEQIQVLELTQSTIRKHIEALCKDEDWGAPYAYDLKIMKAGEGVNTEYSVNPVPHRLLPPYIAKAFSEKPCYLEALFTGADPFSKEWDEFTKLETALSKDQFDEKLAVQNDDCQVCNHEEAETLEKMLSIVPEYKESVFRFLKDSLGVECIEGIKMDIYNRIRYNAIERIDSQNQQKEKSDT